MDQATAQPEPQTAAAEIPAADMDVIIQECQQVLGDMLRLLAFDARLSCLADSSHLRIRLECEDAGRLIGRRGSTVNEIQFLLNRILQRRHKTMPRIFLDVNAPPQAQAASELSARILALADQVRRWGEPADLGPMNAFDCQAVQAVLARDRELEIVSASDRMDANGMQSMRIQLKRA